MRRHKPAQHVDDGHQYAHHLPAGVVYPEEAHHFALNAHRPRCQCVHILGLEQSVHQRILKTDVFQVPDQDHLIAGKNLHPPVDAGKGNLLQDILLGLHARSAPLVGVVHPLVGVDLEHVGPVALEGAAQIGRAHV